MEARYGSPVRSVLIALATGLAIALTKLTLSIVTGSSAMMSEAIHSFADSLNEVFLLIGLKRSQRPAHSSHPIGHGRELYFWTLAAAMSIFTLGGGMSIYEGLTHLQHPEPIVRPWLNYLVLGFSALLDGYAGYKAYDEYRDKFRKKGRGFWASFRAARDLTTFAVLFEQIADLAGVALAAGGVALSTALKSPVPDGIASMLIGGVLITVAILLMQELRSLMIGEAIHPEAIRKIGEIARAHPRVEQVIGLVTLTTGPDRVFVGMEIRFRRGLSVAELGQTIDEIKASIRERFSDVKMIYIQAEHRESWKQAA